MKSVTETNRFQLDTGTVQELFQKDIKKGRSDSEEDFEKNPLHSSYSLINIDTETLCDDEIFLNVSNILKPEGGYVDDCDRENVTRFGLETIVEEMHDQNEDAPAQCGTELEVQKSGLIYEEYEIDLGGQTSEELHRSEEFQRLLTLLSKPKTVAESLTPVASDISSGDKGANILIETTTNRKVECTLKEVKNTKYYLKGDGRMGSGMILAEGVPSVGDYSNCDGKGLHSPSDCSKLGHPCMSHSKCGTYEAPSEPAKPRKSSGRSRSGKSEKRHGAGGSKRCSKSDKKRQDWVSKFNLSSVSNAISDKVKDVLIFIQPKPNTGGNRNILTIVGDAAFKALNLRNVLASVISLVLMLIFVGAFFYKPRGVIYGLIRRFRRRRTPLQAFYDTILTLLHGIIR